MRYLTVSEVLEIYKVRAPNFCSDWPLSNIVQPSAEFTYPISTKHTIIA